jgi:ankyrin repeat protein
MYYAVTALLSWESDHNQQENQGMTPLHLAVMSGKVKVTVRLLMAGCDKKIRNFKDQLPIDLAE